MGKSSPRSVSCRNCGVGFVTCWPSQIFCGKQCRRDAYNANKPNHGPCSVKGCNDPQWGQLEWCNKHQQRVKKYGTTELPSRPSLEERFWSRVDMSGDCWIWRGAVSARERLFFWGNDGKSHDAVRTSYEIDRGRSLKVGERARRTCDEKLCVNPRHLVCTPIERFWSKVEKTDACWNWLGHLNDGGYGIFTIGSKDKYCTPAHRWAYKAFVGPIADDLDVDHVCRNRACVNPDHLRPATNKQNIEHQTPTGRSSASGIRGVFPRGGKWRVGVRHNGKLHLAGPFSSKEEAAEVARELRNQLFTRNNLDRDLA